MRRELTLGAFYAADPRRAHSSEVGYGSLWREFAPVPTYRVEWVRATGELYAVELSELAPGRRGSQLFQDRPTSPLARRGAQRSSRPAPGSFTLGVMPAPWVVASLGRSA